MSDSIEEAVAAALQTLQRELTHAKRERDEARGKNVRAYEVLTEIIAAFHDKRSLALSDTFWLSDGLTVYEAIVQLREALGDWLDNDAKLSV